MEARQPHTIRLHGPWEFRAGTAQLPRRIKLPGAVSIDAEDIDGSSEWALSRVFGRPTNLEGRTVRLIVESPGRPGEARLNDAVLGELSPGHDFTSDVSDRLDERNRLELRFDVDEANKEFAPVASVRLEIS